MENSKVISVLTVTYNSEQFIERYLTSLNKHLPKNAEVIIVDSGSTDKTVKIIKKFKVQLIESKENIGFGRGNNLAAKASSGEFLLLLNPDTELIDDSITKLLEFAQQHLEAGIVVPKLMKFDGSVQESVSKLPTIVGAIKEYYLGIKNSYKFYTPQGNEYVEVENAVGAAMLINKKIFEKAGGFDKKYFLYFEDLDLCRKVRKMGYQIIYYPKAVFKHIVGAAGGDSQKRREWLKDSARLYHGWFYETLLDLVLRFRPLK